MGGYTLTETKAPLGYVLSENPVYTFEISGPNALSIDLGEIENHRAEGPALPLTGGQSAAMFVLLGGGLIAAASALAAIRRKKRIEE